MMLPQDIPVAVCHASPTARPVHPIKVEVLAASIADIGLRQPINVRALPSGGYEVRGGGHRLAAFVRLGKVTIPAFVHDDDDLRAELAEIDENLIRNELSPAERAAAVARRKTIYEALHPETAHGGDRRSSRQLGDLKTDEPERFTKSTADATGASERTVQREAERGEKIGEAALKRVAGTSLDKGEELDALAKLPEDKRGALIDRAAAGEKVSAKIEAKKDKRDTRERDLGAKQIALPAKRYGVILADPEWRFEPYSRETGMDRAADNHYPTSATEVIMARPVADIAADDCVLLLWATAPMLPDALKVMEAWGFAYKTHVIWLKDRVGTGYWFRNQHELLLVGTRGNIPAPAMGTQLRSALAYDVGAHSEKPPFAHEIAESYFPSLPKIELNARRARDGWDAWGLEAPEGDIGIPTTEQHQALASAESAFPPDDPETGEIIEPEAQHGQADLNNGRRAKGDEPMASAGASLASEAGAAPGRDSVTAAPSNSDYIEPEGGDAEAETSTQDRFEGKGEAGEGQRLPDDPASASNVVPLPEEIPFSAGPIDDDLEIPAFLRRGDPACTVKEPEA